MTKLRIIALLSTLAAVGLAQSAQATASSSSSEFRKETVRYADLNVRQEAGARELLRRIERASTRVCGGISPQDRPYVSEQKACRKQAIAEAVKATRSPMLAAVHRGDREILLAQK